MQSSGIMRACAPLFVMFLLDGLRLIVIQLCMGDKYIVDSNFIPFCPFINQFEKLS